MKINIGHLYTNKWGETRVPIFVEENDVIFIRKNEEKHPFFYNPYKDRVTISTFSNNFFDRGISNPLSKESVNKIEKIISEVDSQWKDLLKNGALDIYNVLKDFDQSNESHS